jgi:TPR repeat protein
MGKHLQIWFLILFSAGVSAAVGEHARECSNHVASHEWAKAFESCSRASEFGSAEAQVTLGRMFETGQGVAQDFSVAVNLYLQASRQGLSVGQVNLARMYAIGRGVSQNLILAYAWANVATVSGDQDALYDRSLYARRLSVSEIARAQEISNRCLVSNFKKCN